MRKCSASSSIPRSIDRSDGKARAAFYLANSKRTTLHHIVGMTPAYATCVDGFAIGPQSLACGLAAATRHPVITQDVMKDASWSKWRWLASAFGYRGCWLFPIAARDGNVVGTFAMYHKEPTEAQSRDIALAEVLTSAAADFIERRITAG